MFEKVRFLGVLVIGCAILSIPVLAQLGTGIVAGTVQDSTEAVIPGAEVKVRSLATGVTNALTTNEAGRFQSPPLRPGSYEVSVTSPGFKQYVTTVTLDVEQRLALTASLEVGETTEEITVIAAAQQLQTESTSLGEVMHAEPVNALPLNGRNFARLIELAPGTVPAFTQNAGGLPGTAKRGPANANVNGVRHTWNSILIEGLENQGNHNHFGIVAYPPIDAIQEFKVQRSGADAQFGRAAGGTINVALKSGGREFHGNLYYFQRNAALDAKNFFDRADEKIPHFLWHQFGGTVGGPLTPGRNRTFFFTSMEFKRLRQGLSFVSTVPTARMHQGDFSEHPNTIYDPLSQAGTVRQPFPGNVIPATHIDEVGSNVLDLYPNPNQGGLVRNFTNNPVNEHNGWQNDSKIDHRFTDVHTLSGRFTYGKTDIDEKSPLPPPAAGGGVSGVNTSPVRQISLTDTYVLSPRMFNEARVGWSRLGLVQTNINSDRLNLSDELGIPGVNTGSALTSGMSRINVTGYQNIGDNPFTPAVLVSDNLQFEDNFYLTVGRHSMRLGGRLLRRRYNAFQTQRVRGLMNVTTIFTQNLTRPGGTGVAAADLLLGAADNGGIATLDGTRGLRRNEFGFYVQDDWRVTSALTLNLGVRYEFSPEYPWVEVGDRMSTFLPQTGEILPVGAGGISRSGAETDWNNFAPRIGFAYQLGGKTVLRGAYGIFYAYPQFEINRGLAVNPPFSGRFSYTNSQGNFAGSRKLSDGFERGLGTASAALKALEGDLDLSYVQQWNFNIQRQLPADILLTVGYVGTKGTKLRDEVNINQARPGPGPVAPRRPYPQFQDIAYTTFRANSNYHSMQFSANKRFSRGLSFLVSYTWGRAIDDSGIFGGAHQDSLNLRADRGNADFDVRPTFVSSFVYELPGKNLDGVAGAIAGGWQINGILRLQAGNHFTPSSAQNTLNGSGGQRPDIVAGCDPNDVPGGRSPDRWFNTSCFTTPAQFTFGNTARGVLVGPPTRNFDFSLFKNVDLGSAGDSRRYLQFRAEFFNLTNTPQFNNPNSAIGNPAAGVISAAGSPPSFQRISRQIQFGLKFFF